MKEFETGNLVKLNKKTHCGLGVVLEGNSNNPYLKEYTKVAWIPDKKHPVAWGQDIYFDNVKTEDLILVSE